jgi:hypothetical protein
MILIAHRGNINGPNIAEENNPYYLDDAIERGYCVEVDLRMIKNDLYFGHDYEQYKVKENYLIDRVDHLWIHCKDVLAMAYCFNHPKLHYFWHENDDYTMTNFGYTWAYPGKEVVNDMTIMVMPEKHWNYEEIKQINPIGVCSDYVKMLKV